MLTKVANTITTSLVDKNLIAANNRIASQYGIRQIIIYTINIASTVALGFALGLPLESILMMAAIIELRGYNGGIHAPNDLLCYIFGIVMVFASLKTIAWASEFPINPYLVAMLLFPYCGIIYLLSPVEDKNKPLDDLEKFEYRQRGLAGLSVTLATTLALIMLGMTSLGYAVGMAIIITSTSMVAGYIKNRILEALE